MFYIIHVCLHLHSMRKRSGKMQPCLGKCGDSSILFKLNSFKINLIDLNVIFNIIFIYLLWFLLFSILIANKRLVFTLPIPLYCFLAIAKKAIFCYMCGLKNIWMEMCCHSCVNYFFMPNMFLIVLSSLSILEFSAIIKGNSDVLTQKLLYLQSRDAAAQLECGNRPKTSKWHKVS